MGDEIHRRSPYNTANNAKQMRSGSRWRRRTAKAAVTMPTAAKAAPKNRYGASRRNAVRTSSALISDAPPPGQTPSRYAPSLLTQRLIQISSQHHKRHQDSRHHSLMAENIALCVGPKLVRVVDPISTDLLAPLHLWRSCREDSRRDVHEHLH